MKKLTIVQSMVAISALMVSGCGSSLEGDIKIEGSSTVFPISEAVAEEFNAKHPNVRISIAGQGSGIAFSGLLAGTADIGNASRKIKTSEADALTAAGIDVHEIKLGDDGITIVVPTSNTWMTDISVDELKQLWLVGSTVDSWDDIRSTWPAQPIRLFGPGAESGTLEFFREAVLGKDSTGAYNAIRNDYTPSEDDNVLVTGVAGNTYSMGFFGFAYYLENTASLKAVPVINKGSTTPVTPSLTTISNGTYAPLARPLYMYVNVEAYQEKEAVREFVDFFLSEDGRVMVSEVGYSPLTDAAYDAALTAVQGLLG